MKITEIKVETIRLELKEPLKVAFGEIPYSENVLVKVMTDEGLTGYGEGAPFPFVLGETLASAMEVLSLFRRALTGMDALDIEGIHRTMDQTIAGNTAVKCAVDLALYDLYGKMCAQPVYKILGGSNGKVVNDITIGIGIPEQMAEKARELAEQLKEQNICVDEMHPLFVYIPCGVGGAPGGIAFGLKELFGPHVHCFFVEPTQAPCMLLGMATGLQNKIAVRDIGLSGITHADGLAVVRASSFVGQMMRQRVSGIFTAEDRVLYEYMRKMLETEKIFLEPSACAAFMGLVKLLQYEETKKYLETHGVMEHLVDAVHIVWATGGSLVPEEMREIYRNTYL